MIIRKITKKELDQIISLRRRGWTYQSLAYIYGVDHSSIYHLCKKYHADKGTPEVVFNLPAIIEESQPVDVVSSVVSILVRHKPESYAEFLLQIK